MRVGFDAKRVFHNATGLGNYGRDVLRVLHRLHPEHQLVAYTPRLNGIAFGFGERFEVHTPEGAPGRAFPAAWRTVGVAADAARDGVELFHGLSAELPLGLSRLGIASVVTVHDLIFERYPQLYSAVDRRIYRWKARSAAQRANLVVAISEQTKRDLVDLYGVPAAKIRVVYQGCHEAFRAPITREALADVARRLDLPGVFLLSVGTVERRKNLEVVLRAMAGLPGVPLVAVGRATPYREELRALARSLGIEDRVRFLSSISLGDLAALYRLATVALYPSIFEGFGIPILEALCSGTPVVTTRGGCFAEAGGPATAYADPYDPEEWRTTLAGLLADPERRQAMAAAGLGHAERFADARVAEALDAVYREARG
jgi:glycosyltransferase involved in cell wall biosynthesis